MGQKTGIQWTGVTWNPIRGCSRVSPGCVNCYAEYDAHRVNRQMAAQGRPEPYGGLVKLSEKGDPRWVGEVRVIEDRLGDPLRWTKPRVIFVNSMSDLFHESLPFETIAAIFGIMAASGQHVFQVLTKRSERMKEFFAWLDARPDMGVGEPAPYPMANQVYWCLFYASNLFGNISEARYPEVFRFKNVFRQPSLQKVWPLPNVWVGVSAENQEYADLRIPDLIACPAAIHWVSIEPALGPVVLREEWIEKLDWLVVGGESDQPGRQARMFDVDWAKSLILQTRGTSLKVFVKQLGKRPWWSGSGGARGTKPPADHVYLEQGVVGPDGRIGWQYDLLRNRKGGDPEEWPIDLRVREMPGDLDVKGFA